MNNSNYVFLGLGSNKGDKYHNLLECIIKLHQHKNITLVACSSIYESPAMGFKSNDFYNLVLAMQVNISALELLQITQDIEKSFGRKIKPERNTNYQERVMDIDLLIFRNEKIQLTNLTIPHPQINNRLFVIKPLQELLQALELYTFKKPETNSVMEQKQKVKKTDKISEKLQEELKQYFLEQKLEN